MCDISISLSQIRAARNSISRYGSTIQATQLLLIRERESLVTIEGNHDNDVDIETVFMEIANDTSEEEGKMDTAMSSDVGKKKKMERDTDLGSASTVPLTFEDVHDADDASSDDGAVKSPSLKAFIGDSSVTEGVSHSNRGRLQRLSRSKRVRRSSLSVSHTATEVVSESDTEDAESAEVHVKKSVLSVSHTSVEVVSESDAESAEMLRMKQKVFTKNSATPVASPSHPHTPTKSPRSLLSLAARTLASATPTLSPMVTTTSPDVIETEGKTEGNISRSTLPIPPIDVEFVTDTDTASESGVPCTTTPLLSSLTDLTSTALPEQHSLAGPLEPSRLLERFRPPVAVSSTRDTNECNEQSNYDVTMATTHRNVLDNTADMLQEQTSSQPSVLPSLADPLDPSCVLDKYKPPATGSHTTEGCVEHNDWSNSDVVMVDCTNMPSNATDLCVNHEPGKSNDFITSMATNPFISMLKIAKVESLSESSETFSPVASAFDPALFNSSPECGASVSTSATSAAISFQTHDTMSTSALVNGDTSKLAPSKHGSQEVTGTAVHSCESEAGTTAVCSQDSEPRQARHDTKGDDKKSDKTSVAVKLSTQEKSALKTFEFGFSSEKGSLTCPTTKEKPKKRGPKGGGKGKNWWKDRATKDKEATLGPRTGGVANPNVSTGDGSGRVRKRRRRRKLPLFRSGSDSVVAMATTRVLGKGTRKSVDLSSKTLSLTPQMDVSPTLNRALQSTLASALAPALESALLSANSSTQKFLDPAEPQNSTPMSPVLSETLQWTLNKALSPAIESVLSLSGSCSNQQLAVGGGNVAEKLTGESEETAVGGVHGGTRSVPGLGSCDLEAKSSDLIQESHDLGIVPRDPRVRSCGFGLRGRGKMSKSLGKAVGLSKPTQGSSCIVPRCPPLAVASGSAARGARQGKRGDARRGRGRQVGNLPRKQQKMGSISFAPSNATEVNDLSGKFQASSSRGSGIASTLYSQPQTSTSVSVAQKPTVTVTTGTVTMATGSITAATGMGPVTMTTANSRQEKVRECEKVKAQVDLRPTLLSLDSLLGKIKEIKSTLHEAVVSRRPPVVGTKQSAEPPATEQAVPAKRALPVEAAMNLKPVQPVVVRNAPMSSKKKRVFSKPVKRVRPATSDTSDTSAPSSKRKANEGGVGMTTGSGELIKLVRTTLQQPVKGNERAMEVFAVEIEKVDTCSKVVGPEAVQSMGQRLSSSMDETVARLGIGAISWKELRDFLQAQSQILLPSGSSCLGANATFANVTFNPLAENCHLEQDTVPDSVLELVFSQPVQPHSSESVDGKLCQMQRFKPYVSPLLSLSSYRIHPNYQTQEKLSLSSLSHSHKINPMKIWCRFEVFGKCGDPHCPWQHLRDVTLSKSELLDDIAAYSPAPSTDSTGISESDPRKSLRKQSYVERLKENLSGKASDDQLLVLAARHVNNSKREEGGGVFHLEEMRGRPRKDEDMDEAVRTR